MNNMKPLSYGFTFYYSNKSTRPTTFHRSAEINFFKLPPSESVKVYG